METAARNPTPVRVAHALVRTPSPVPRSINAIAREVVTPRRVLAPLPPNPTGRLATTETRARSWTLARAAAAQALAPSLAPRWTNVTQRALAIREPAFAPRPRCPMGRPVTTEMPARSRILARVGLAR